jgi:hypothetical protein
MINTNGLELVRREGLAAELARRRPRWGWDARLTWPTP